MKIIIRIPYIIKNRFIRICSIALVILSGLCCVEEPSKNFLISYGDTFVVTTSYGTGGYAVIDQSSLVAVTDDFLGKGKIHSDAVARYFNGRIYVINRLGRDNVQALEPQLGYLTVAESSMGASSNPHDIAVVSSDKAYVTRYGASDIWIIDPITCLFKGSIDLSMYADPSAGGIPHMSRLYYHEGTGRLFISLQRLQANWHPGAYGSVVVIDTTNDSIIGEIRLQWNGGAVSAKNPYTHFRFVPGAWWQPPAPDGNDHLFLSCVGEFGYYLQLDCGIVAVDIQDMQCEEGYILKEDIIDSEITDFVIKSGTEGYATTSDANFHSRMIKFNPQDGTITKVIQADYGDYGYLWSLALHSSGKLFLCDRNVLLPGVRVYDTNADDFHLNYGLPINVGLPPFDVVFME